MKLPSKSGVIVCPNPKCNREIGEPILLNNLSRTPVEQYYACPHCLIKLETDVENEENAIEESGHSPHLHPSLEKVLNAVSSKQQKDIEEEEAPVKPPKIVEKGPTKCPHYFGYLTHRPKDTSIPQECLICPKIVECMLKL